MQAGRGGEWAGRTIAHCTVCPATPGKCPAHQSQTNVLSSIHMPHAAWQCKSQNAHITPTTAGWHVSGKWGGQYQAEGKRRQQQPAAKAQVGRQAGGEGKGRCVQQ